MAFRHGSSQGKAESLSVQEAAVHCLLRPTRRLLQTQTRVVLPQASRAAAESSQAFGGGRLPATTEETHTYPPPSSPFQVPWILARQVTVATNHKS